jgi:hypothetical protein
MQESVAKPSGGSRCRGTNRKGEPCRRLASSNGQFCVVHSGKVDMREIGKLGGRGRTRSVLGISDVVADERLRAQGKKALEELVNSDNESVRLRAATALYSYRSQAPPVEQPREHGGPGKVIGLGDLLRVAVECGHIVAERGGAVMVAGEAVERADPSPRTRGRRAAVRRVEGSAVDAPLRRRPRGGLPLT